MFTVWTCGGGHVLFHVFNALAMLMGTEGVEACIRLLGLVTVIYGVIHAQMHQSLVASSTMFLWFICASHILFLPKATVIIHDAMHAQKYVVANIPWSLALTAGTLSSLMHHLTKTVEQVYTPPRYTPYEQTGLVFGSRFALACQCSRIRNPSTATHLQKFIKRCTIQEALMGTRLSFTQIKQSQNIWETMKQSAHPTLGFFWHDNGQRSFISCRDAAKRLDTLIKQEVALATEDLNHNLKGIASHPSHAVHVAHAAQSQAHNATQIISHMLIYNSIHNHTKKALSMPYSQARLQQHWGAQLSWRLAEDVLPALKIFLEALAYGAFILVILLTLLPGGWRTLSIFAGLLTWIHSWPFFFTLLNMIIHANTRATPPLSINSLDQFFSIHSHTVDIAGIFALSIPALSYMILKGGAGAIVHLAHHLGAQIQSITSQHAHSLASGSTHIADSSVNTHRAHEQHGFKMDTRAVHHGHNIVSTGNDGSIHTLTPSNKTLTQQGGGLTHTQLAFSIQGRQSLEQYLSNESSTQKLQAERALQDFHHAHNTALAQLFSHQEGHGIHNNASLNQSQSSQIQNVQHAENIVAFQRYLENKHGLDTQHAQRVAWGMSMSIPLANLLGPSFNNDTSKSEISSTSISDMQSLANTMNIRESWSKIMGSNTDHTQSQGSSHHQALNHDIQKSLTKSAQFLNAWHHAHEHQIRLENAARVAHNHQVITEKDYTEEFIAFAQKHQNTSRLNTISSLNEQNLLRSKLLEEFFQKKSADFIHMITPADRTHTSPENIQRSFDALSHDIKHFMGRALHVQSITPAPPPLDAQFQQNKAEIFNTIRSKSDNLKK